MIQKTESDTLTDNPILGLESEIRALKETVGVMRDEMEAMGFAKNQAIQETKLENANEVKALKGTAAALRDELEKSKFDMGEAVQAAKLASNNEVKSLKGTASSLRDELEKSRFDMAEAVQAAKLASNNEVKALKGTASSLRDELEKSRFDMAEAIQKEKLASKNEVKALKGTAASLRDELEKRSSKVANESIIKDKKFRGGLVVEPKEGVHFDVTVMDFASLYPSIIKVKNLSYETVRCTHDECEKNTVPQTNHWVCTKKNGLTSVIIGSLRDLRVNYYKTMGKKSSLTDEERQLFTVVSQALKVILNASYGVMGAEIFPLYFLPAAEATTAVGRHIILDTIDMCEKVGINVLYGDTDSLFVKNLSQEQIQEIIVKAKSKHNVELEVDKEYRYVVLSNRKKNYLGVTKNGKVDVKGLTGKKSHTPKFIKTLFFEILDILSEVKSVEEFNDAKNRVSDKISNCARKIQAREVPLTELAFNVMTSKAPHEYTKTIPQHIRAALQLQTIREIKRGDIISYVKILNKPGVKPVELAKQSEIDAGKYMEFMQSTLDQITSSMDLDFDSILGKPKQTGLDQFFWN